MKYMVVVEYSSWPPRRQRFGPIVDNLDDVERLCAAAAREHSGFNRLIVLHSFEENVLEDAFASIEHTAGSPHAFFTPDAIEIERRKLEDGLGGDHDVPYQFEMTQWGPTIAKWAELLARVQDGRLGGENDGELDDPSVASEGEHEANG